MGRKLEVCCAPLGEGELGPHLTQCGQVPGLPACQLSSYPSNRLATVHQCHRQTDRTGQDNGPIAYGEPFYKRSPNKTANINRNKWSAVAEMGDRLATTDMGQKRGLLCPFLVGGVAGSPSNTMWPGPRRISVASGIFIHPAIWEQQTWAENWGVCSRGLNPHLTVWPGPRLPLYQVAS